jgi:hypothetical protein
LRDGHGGDIVSKHRPAHTSAGVTLRIRVGELVFEIERTFGVQASSKEPAKDGKDGTFARGIV